MKAVCEYGMSLGDGPFKWWVTFEEVALKKCKQVEEIGPFLANPSAPLSQSE